MVIELKKSIDAGKIFFGVKQSIKNSKNLKGVYVPKDVRSHTLKMLEQNNIKFEIIEHSKKEIAQKLEIDFYCEVFGLRK